MKSTFNRLGDYIVEIDNRNKDSKDGKEYTYLASSQPTSYDPGNKVPEPSRKNDLCSLR